MNLHLIPYLRGLQQNKRREWESNLCPSASTGSQVQLTTPWLPWLTFCAFQVAMGLQQNNDNDHDDFTCVLCNVCSYTRPPVLSHIREDKVMYSKSLTQGHCSRMNTGSENRTSAPVQALDHKSNSLPLRHCA